MTVRRTHPRHAARVKLKISFPDVDEFQHVYSKNISKGGMFLATPKPLDKGRRVMVRLVPPGATRGFEIEGEIAHSVDTPTAIKKKCTPGMGIKFINLNSALKAALDQYIKDLLAGKEPAEPQAPTGPVEQPQAAGPAAARPAAQPAAKPAARPAAGAGAAPPGATLPLYRPPTASRPAGPPDPRRYLQHLDAATRALRTKNYYEFLGVEPTVTRDELRRAYNRLAKMFHPDLAPPVLSAADKARVSGLFASLGEIFEKLGDARTRVMYDLSIGVNREPENDEERTILTEERARFREAYVQQFPDRVAQARRFAVMAEAASGAGNVRAAANNFKLALSLDPMNDEYRRKMDALKR